MLGNLKAFRKLVSDHFRQDYASIENILKGVVVQQFTDRTLIASLSHIGCLTLPSPSSENFNDIREIVEQQFSAKHFRVYSVLLLTENSKLCEKLLSFRQQHPQFQGNSMRGPD